MNRELASIALILAGAYLRYLIGRRRFNRRNMAGMQMFRSYADAILTRLWESGVRLTGSALILYGLLCIAAQLINH